MLKKIPWIIGGLILVLAGYLLVSEMSFNKESKKPLEVTEKKEEKRNIVLAFQKLEPLAKGHYEGWLVFKEGEESRKISFGKFNVSANGGLEDLSGIPIVNRFSLEMDDDPFTAQEVIITIEPSTDVDESPSGAVILAGKLSQLGLAALEFSSVNLTDSSGQYILGTPTNDPAGDETSGLWFLLPGPEPAPSLVMPPVPTGWKYEGWAVHQDAPLSTGRFSDTTGSDEAALYSGSKPAPFFPGEDFLENEPEDLDFEFPIDLADGATQVVISLEPDIAGEDPTGDGPFQLKPFVGNIPAGAADHELLDLFKDLSGFPEGQAVIQ